MKKRLEAELISIAHRILKLKNKSEVDQLYKETQKLYETLSVLKFYQDNFESIKSDISQEDLEEKIEKTNEVEVPQEIVPEIKEEVFEPLAVVENELEIDVNEPEAKPEIEAEEEEVIIPEEAEQFLEEEEILEEEVVEEKAEEVEEVPFFKPIFELEVEDEEEVEPAETASEEKPKERLEDHIGNYVDPVFVKPNDVSLFPSETVAEELKVEPKASIFNEGTSKSIAIGLNDRIGFVQHLFNDSNEDFNRVISQLNTFDSFEEAKNFINEMVIPDYNYWIGQEDYLVRFMEIVEKKFQ